MAAEQPRVLLACEWFVKYTAGLARGLADNGCDVVLLSRDHDLEFGGEPGAMRAFVAAMLDGRARHIEIGGRVRDPSKLREMLALRRQLGRWNPDFVHIQDSLTHDLRLAVAGGYPWRRYADTVHDPAPHPGDPQPSTRIRVVRKHLRRHADLIFTHSQVLVDELRALGDIRHAAEIVPHGIALPEPAPLPERPSLLFFGRISHYKGLDTLLDAMPAVWERVPETTLVVAGSGEVEPHPVLDDPRVTLRNEHVTEEAVPGLFEAATCVVLPYRQASQSGIGSEAKQYGRAMIVTDVGGLPDLVADGGGRVVPAEDPPALAAAIAELVSAPGLAAEVGAEAAASIGEASWDNVGAMTLAAYERYLSG
ncbi:MAG TPA: glycosyltransferase family 4 protein [Solirubrobacterales bacterium]|nr:glycosyltransferase family 4 protein [Solirubrobacterales bacterium]